jgi:hypothetical protein
MRAMRPSVTVKSPVVPLILNFFCSERWSSALAAVDVPRRWQDDHLRHRGSTPTGRALVLAHRDEVIKRYRQDLVAAA